MSFDPELLKKYPKEKIEEAIAYLSYKKITRPLPKEETGKYLVMYVFRHGQTVDNANFVFSGWRDSKLTETGRKQAKELADKLKDKKIQMLICSDQIRSIETMKIAMSKNPYTKNIEIIRDPRIKERCYGDLQGKSKLLMQLENPNLLLLERRDYHFAPPNGESIEMVVKRVYEFINEIVPLMKQNKVNVAISCHGNSVRGFRQHFEQLSDEQTAQIETPLGQDYAAYSIT